MGPELLAAAALAGGGTLVSSMADRRAAKDQRNILNRAVDRSSQTQGRATDMVLQEAQKYAPTERMANMNAQEQQNFEQAQRDGAVPGVATESNAGAGQVMSLGAMDKALAEGNRMTAIAREMAKVRAPNQLAASDQIRRADLAANTGSMWADDRANANAASLDAQEVSTPWWGTLGKVGQAVGMSMAGNALAGAGPGAGTVTGGKGITAGSSAGYGGLKASNGGFGIKFIGR